jgi:hypothetical protein
MRMGRMAVHPVYASQPRSVAATGRFIVGASGLDEIVLGYALALIGATTSHTAK